MKVCSIFSQVLKLFSRTKQLEDDWMVAGDSFELTSGITSRRAQMDRFCPVFRPARPLVR